MAWQKLIITTQANEAKHLADLLEKTQALSITLEDAADQAVFAVNVDDQPLWQQVNVCALFDTDIDLAPLLAILKTQLKQNDAIRYKTETIEDQDWVRMTQQQFQPQCFGNDLWICPAWCCDEKLKGTLVRLDPGLAFGTGTHPTTALCLEWLAQHPPKDQVVMDYGCGSGILALAALALSAKKVIAIDHDPQAIESTQNNAALNDFVTNDNLEIFQNTDLPIVKAQTVIANILANPLMTLAPTLSGFLDDGANLILSGILTHEEQPVLLAYKNTCEHINTQHQEGWIRIDLQKRK